jgi:hypothetical protein
VPVESGLLGLIDAASNDAVCASSTPANNP